MPRTLFAVTEHPVFRVISCPDKLELDNSPRFSWAWHDFVKCPDCQRIPEGYEFWGENGHKQGRLPQPADAAYIERRGWTLTKGDPIYYRG